MQPRQLWSNLHVAATAVHGGRPALLAAILMFAFAAAPRACLRLSRYTVRGPSMEPALSDGDRLLVLRGPCLPTPRPGTIVLARPRALAGREIVKRVAATERTTGGSRVTLLGDNSAASTDSRSFGPVPHAELTGRVLLRYWPDDRRGRIPSSTATNPGAAPPGHPAS